MENITHYSDQELTLLFLNEENLYRVFTRAVRRGDFTIIKDLCDEIFVYNDDQLEDLRDMFNNELEEYENN